MAFKVYDRVKETSSTAGSGTITLAGAVNGFQAFGDVYSNGDTTHYVIVNARKWETGLGTYSSGTLSRDTVFESSNNDQLVTLAGASTVFVSYPAARTVLAESSSFGHSGVPYVNASGHLNDNAGLVYDYTNQNLNVGGNVSAQSGVLNVVDFNPISAPAYQEGLLYYDAGDKCITVYNDEPEISLQVGQESYIRIKNNSGSAIANGEAVRITGAQGTHTTIERAIATTKEKAEAVGLATHDIEKNGFGYITTFGLVRGLNTNAFNEGQEVFLSTAASGALTGVAPVSPNYQVSIGHVVRRHSSQGSILVTPGIRRLGGGDVETLTTPDVKGVTFYTADSSSSDGILSSNPNFVYESGDQHLGLNQTSPDAALHASPSNTTEPAAIFEAVPAQTSNLTEWHDASGNAVAYVTSSGDAHFNNLMVTGVTTYVNTNTLTVQDKNIELASVSGSALGNDAIADGGGITLKSSDGDKTITWNDSSNSWNFNQNIDIDNGYSLSVNDYTLPTSDGSGNYIIKTDGSGTLDFVNIDTLVSAATGVSSGIAFFDDGGNLTSSTNFTVDSGNGIIHSSGFFDYKDWGSNRKSLSIGLNNSATAYDQIAIGKDITLTSPIYGDGAGQIGIGSNLTFGKASVAIGHDITGGGWTSFGNVSIGSNIINNGRYSIAIGGITRSAHGNVTIGYQASGVAGESVTIGEEAVTTTATSVAIGYRAYAHYNSIAIGPRTQAGKNTTFGHYIAIGARDFLQHGNTSTTNGGPNGWIGYGQTFTCGNKNNFGSTAYSEAMHNVYFGAGYEHTADMNGYYVDFYGTHGNGTNIGGMAVRMRPGRGTGSARGGHFEIDLGLAGSSGTTINTYYNVFRADASDGSVYTLAATASTVPAVVQGVAAQSANLQEWQNSAGSGLAHVDSSGGIVCQDMTVSGNLTLAGGFATENTNNGIISNINEGGSTSFYVTHANGSTVAYIGASNPAGSESISLYVTSAAPYGGLRILGQNVLQKAGAGQPLQFNPSYQDMDFVFYPDAGSANPILFMDSVEEKSVFGGSNSDLDGQLGVKILDAADAGVTIKGAASQSGNLQEWQNNVGTVQASIDANGYIDTTGNISASGDISIGGHLSATTKSFLIDHPTKDGKLQYASLEGPENGVYVRGATNEDEIILPDYWSALVHEDSITVSLTSVGEFQPLYVESKSVDKITVGGATGNYDYVVYAERKDVPKLEVEKWE